MRYESISTALVFAFHLPVTCVCESLDVKELHHDFAMSVQDRLCAALSTTRRHIHDITTLS